MVRVILTVPIQKPTFESRHHDQHSDKLLDESHQQQINKKEHYANLNIHRQTIRPSMPMARQKGHTMRELGTAGRNIYACVFGINIDGYQLSSAYKPRVANVVHSIDASIARNATKDDFKQRLSEVVDEFLDGIDLSEYARKSIALNGPYFDEKASESRGKVWYG